MILLGCLLNLGINLLSQMKSSSCFFFKRSIYTPPPSLYPSNGGEPTLDQRVGLDFKRECVLALKHTPETHPPKNFTSVHQNKNFIKVSYVSLSLFLSRLLSLLPNSILSLISLSLYPYPLCLSLLYH